MFHSLPPMSVTVTLIKCCEPYRAILNSHLYFSFVSCLAKVFFRHVCTCLITRNPITAFYFIVQYI